jgi:hypothetical protein
MGGRRGRKTVEDVMWQAGVPIIPGRGISPLKPPSDLEAAEARLWRAITSRLIPSYFQAEHVPLLKAYVRHSVISDVLAKRASELRATMATDAKAFESWCGITREIGAQSAILCSLATKLRLCHSSRLTQQLATIDAQAQPSDLAPWRDWGDRAKAKEPTEN